jgi:hypothetical protein
MQKKTVCRIGTMILLLFSGLVHANDLNSLFSQVEKLKIERHGYVLGRSLDQGQMKRAASNPVDATTPDTFKFKDKNLFVLAHKTTNRVLVIYEQSGTASQQQIQDLIGDLYMNFDDPTVMAHDKVVYWAYTKKGKITSKEFDTAKQDLKKLDILATVKFVSDINIMGKAEEPSTGQVYYIISSDPILKLLSD